MPSHHARRRPRHRATGPLAGRPAQAIVLVAVLAVLGAVTVALLGDRPGAPSTSGTAPDRATATAGQAGAPAAEALLDWADRELPPGTRLHAGEDLRDDLLAAGAPEDLVTTDRPDGEDDLLLTVGDGSGRPGGLVVARVGGLVLRDPAPGSPSDELLARRRALAEAVLANPTTRAREPAAAVLRSAEVDMRLLSLLAVLTARQGLGVAAFPRAEGAEGPARSVLLDAVGDAPVGAGEAATAELRTWLEAQLRPFAPDHVEVTDEGVLLSYRYASDPDALVAEGTP